MGVDAHVRVLVIQQWTIDLEAIVSSLADAGISAAITRVDFAAALDAALAHDRFDIAIYDPATPELGREQVHERLRTRDIPIVVLEVPAAVGPRVASVLESRRN